MVVRRGSEAGEYRSSSVRRRVRESSTWILSRSHDERAVFRSERSARFGFQGEVAFRRYRPNSRRLDRAEIEKSGPCRRQSLGRSLPRACRAQSAPPSDDADPHRNAVLAVRRTGLELGGESRLAAQTDSPTLDDLPFLFSVRYHSAGAPPAISPL